MQRAMRNFLVGAAAFAAVANVTSPARACGGFFCSQTQPVNQAAERIVFADNGDGTVTAVIQIMYQGPSESFSWLLPISSVPEGDEIAVASNLAFQRLQSATNPQYNLTTRTEGQCSSSPASRGVSDGEGSSGGAGGGGGIVSPPSVVVEGSGVVGNFEWTVISVDDSLPEPADVALNWLRENGYDVPVGSGGLIAPYLEEGLYLLALRLTKGSDAGSIRPIVLTYEAARPMIPIKLTAVAANDDMGVMTWLLGDARAVPQNYLALELNEARINWFNASSNYNDVVTAAANDAQGQGFVTEFAGPSSSLANVVWTPYDETNWQGFSNGVYTSFQDIFQTAYGMYNTYDGFWDAVRSTVTLPAGLAFEDFKVCPNCYSSQIQFSPAAFIAALESGVVEPVRLVQDLIDAHPTVTRLYSTLSAAEMTLDPLFTFNPDLPDVSNIHTAERIIECNSNVSFSEATWRIELPQGGVVRGTADQVGTWPDAMSEQPANFRILRQGESGDGRVVEDNADSIDGMLDDYNSGIPSTRGRRDTSDGCTVGAHHVGSSVPWLLAALVAFAWRRRRSARADMPGE
jgi:hypothetical protein